MPTPTRGGHSSDRSGMTKGDANMTPPGVMIRAPEKTITLLDGDGRTLLGSPRAKRDHNILTVEYQRPGDFVAFSGQALHSTVPFNKETDHAKTTYKNLQKPIVNKGHTDDITVQVGVVSISEEAIDELLTKADALLDDERTNVGFKKFDFPDQADQKRGEGARLPRKMASYDDAPHEYSKLFDIMIQHQRSKTTLVGNHRAQEVHVLEQARSLSLSLSLPPLALGNPTRANEEPRVCARADTWRRL